VSVALISAKRIRNEVANLFLLNEAFDELEENDTEDESESDEDATRKL
jgi:hypothetical protein